MPKHEQPLGERLKQFRRQKGLSVAAFSKKYNINKDNLYKWEKGTKPSDYKDAIELERILFMETNEVEEPQAGYGKVVNPADYLTHEMIKMKAIVQIILRSQAEILAEKRGETVSKVLGELSKAVRDEISVSVSELQQGKG